MSAVASARTRASTRNRGLFFIALASAGLLVAVMLPLVFAWPRGAARIPNQPFAAGSVDDYGLGSITRFVDREFYLVRPSRDVFLALSSRTPGRGCTISWRPNLVWPNPITGDLTEGWFHEPCGGSTFDREGRRVYGPADRYVVTIVNDEITVDTGVYVCGFSPPGEPCEVAAP
jgi:hypothetical protein